MSLTTERPRSSTSCVSATLLPHGLVLQLRFAGTALPVAGFSEELMGAPPERPSEDHGEIGWAKGLADARKKAAQLRHAERHQPGKSLVAAPF